MGITQVMEETLSLAAQPGRSVQLQSSLLDNPLLEVTRSPNGFITIRTPPRDQNLTRSDRDDLPNQESPIPGNNPEFLHHPWNTIRICSRQMRRAGEQWAMENRMTAGQARQTALLAERSLREEKNNPVDTLTPRFREHLQSLFDSSIDGQFPPGSLIPTVRQYNILAILDPDGRREIREKHPTVLDLALRFMDQREVERLNAMGTEHISIQELGAAVAGILVQAGVRSQYTSDILQANLGKMNNAFQNGALPGMRPGLNILGKACESWRNNWKNPDPGMNQAIRECRDQVMPGWGQDQAVEEIIRTTDPQAHHIMRKFVNTPQQEQYLTAHSGGRHIQELQETNPGAVGWVLRFHQPAEPVQHPGQVVRAARSLMLAAGMRPEMWRRITRLQPPAMLNALTSIRLHQDGIPVLEALAESGAQPAPTTLRDTAGMSQNLGLSQERRTALLKLAFQESQRRLEQNPQDQLQRELRIEIRHAADYCVQMERDQEEMTARTWKGLMRRSERWHRERLQAQNRNARDKLLRESGGTQRAWDSCIGNEITLNGLVLHHLGSQLDLISEGSAMRHCCATYDGRCIQGTSRIFSIQEDGRRIATGEISLDGDAWKNRQNQGPDNSRPPEQAKNAMLSAARLYQKAWQAGKRHQTWVEPAGAPAANTNQAQPE